MRAISSMDVASCQRESKSTSVTLVGSKGGGIGCFMTKKDFFLFINLIHGMGSHGVSTNESV